MNAPPEAAPMTRTPRTWTTTHETSDTLVMVAGDGAQVAAIRLGAEWLVVATEAEANQPWFSEWFHRSLVKREVRYLMRRMKYPAE
jgi:hypothetical protein